MEVLDRLFNLLDSVCLHKRDSNTHFPQEVIFALLLLLLQLIIITKPDNCHISNMSLCHLLRIARLSLHS